MEGNKDIEKEEMSPDMCAKAGKCMMKEMMDKMKNKPSESEYKKLSDEEKDRTDEKEVMEDE